MDNAVEIVVADGTDAACDVRLLPGRAALLADRATLLVADLHLGKAAAFRAEGLPVPEGSAQKDLRRLAALVDASAARRLVVLGDLFHAASGCTKRVFEEFTAFRDAIASVEVVLVLGNHDRRIRLPQDLGIDAVLPELVEGSRRFVHEPPEAAGPGVVFCGHLHPRLAIRAPGGGRCTERCFVEHAGRFVLPAFGSFTGAGVVEVEEGMRLWAAGIEGVVDVTRMAALAAR